MLKEYQMACAAELESLAILRDFAVKTCQEANISEDIGYQLKLAIDEACTNIIQHGYAGMNPGSIILNIKHIQDKLIVTITDFGHSFEPAKPEELNVETIMASDELSGFGLHIIYQIMDSVHYEATDMGNELRLIKKIVV